ncbi:hypothetical protein BCV70DRAFT_45961 [Testicularia cyperi]|uniref:Uncharacterized protein n=1 Tax=Testicularia cyperi TaxID=1882483 RepID=A0A317XHS1_9BASI|nr:hypothetical protein BCV70DRAFT_45961 [Testicularia cyperi]
MNFWPRAFVAKVRLRFAHKLAGSSHSCRRVNAGSQCAGALRVLRLYTLPRPARSQPVSRSLPAKVDPTNSGQESSFVVYPPSHSVNTTLHQAAPPTTRLTRSASIAIAPEWPARLTPPPRRFECSQYLDHSPYCFRTALPWASFVPINGTSFGRLTLCSGGIVDHVGLRRLQGISSSPLPLSSQQADSDHSLPLECCDSGGGGAVGKGVDAVVGACAAATSTANVDGTATNRTAASVVVLCANISEPPAPRRRHLAQSWASFPQPCLLFSLSS